MGLSHWKGEKVAEIQIMGVSACKPCIEDITTHLNVCPPWEYLSSLVPSFLFFRIAFPEVGNKIIQVCPWNPDRILETHTQFNHSSPEVAKFKFTRGGVLNPKDIATPSKSRSWTLKMCLEGGKNYAMSGFAQLVTRAHVYLVRMRSVWEQIRTIGVSRRAPEVIIFFNQF